MWVGPAASCESRRKTRWFVSPAASPLRAVLSEAGHGNSEEIRFDGGRSDRIARIQMAYWRVTSFNLRNLVDGIRAGIWGQESPVAFRSWMVGDRLAFYCSGSLMPEQRGYWAVGSVTRPLFTERIRVWGDAHYPHRVGFQLEGELLAEPIRVAAVQEALGRSRLLYFRRRSIIQLAQSEFDVIAGLIAEARGERFGGSAASTRPDR